MFDDISLAKWEHSYFQQDGSAVHNAMKYFKTVIGLVLMDGVIHGCPDLQIWYHWTIFSMGAFEDYCIYKFTRPISKNKIPAICR